MGESQPEYSGQKAVNVILDVSSLPLEEVFSDDNSALAHAVRRLVDELKKTNEQYAAHSSSS